MSVSEACAHLISNRFESSADAVKLAQHADLAIRLTMKQPLHVLTNQQNFHVLCSRDMYSSVSKWLSYMSHKWMVAGMQLPFCNMCATKNVHMLN